MLPQFTQNFAIPPKSSNDLGKEKFFHLVIRAQLNIQGGELLINIQCNIHGEDKYASELCPNCNYSFGNSCDHR